MHAYDVYAIGNALVDTEYEVPEAWLSANGVAKGQMTLIDTHQRASLLKALGQPPSRRTAGGSAGNTVVAMAQLGSKAFYSCRVADDELGAFYARDLQAHGVATNLTHTRPAEGQTGSCVVLITPDGERSMSTFLGATAELDADALQTHDLLKSRVYYMEGYLAASPSGLAAALQGRALAAQAGVKLAATLSDVSMINFCREGLDALVGSVLTTTLDYLFCNEQEAHAWSGHADWAAVCHHLRQQARVVCITRGPKGCVVLHGADTIEVATQPVRAVDSNGAGDMFAGAFLYGITQGRSLAEAAALANRAAAAVVSQYGCRLPQAQMDTIRHSFPV